MKNTIKFVNLDKEKIIKEYKRLVYKDFPKDEIKDINTITLLIDKNIFSGIEVFDADIMVGYCFISQFDGYVYFEYLAVIKEFRDMGYGSKIISKLKQFFCNSKAIFCDIQDKDYYCDNLDKEFKIKREMFYEKNNFLITNFKFLSWGERMKLIYLPLLIQPSSEDLFDCYMKLRLEVYLKAEIYKNIKIAKK